jgi:hypothetical protein
MRLRKQRRIFTSGASLAPESPDPVLSRLRASLDQLEAAAERRARREAALSDAEAEFALMQDDRARLAVELDAALDSQRKLGEANAAAIERITRAAATIERWLHPHETAQETRKAEHE